RVHEPFNDQVGRLHARQPTAHKIEDLLLVHLANGSTMCTAKDVVAADLQIRDRVSTCSAAEQQIAVLLVGGSPTAFRQHADQSGVAAACFVGENALKQQVAGAAGGAMVLQGVAVKMLVAILDIEALQLGTGPITAQNALDPPL